MSGGPSGPAPIIIIRRKRAHGGGHHGGAWKVAFADFMTAMFTLFLVLWLVNQSSDVKSAIAGYFQDPLGRADEFGSSIIPGTGSQAATVRPLQQSDIIEMRRDKMRTAAEAVKKAIEASGELSGVKNNIEITLTKEGLHIELLEDASGTFFQSGSASPSDRGRAILTLLGTELGSLENPIHIEGHTDSNPLQQRGTYSNWELSADRANAARRIMAKNGLHPRQVTQIRGLADRDPRDPANPASSRNRRIAIDVLLAPGEQEMVAAGMMPDLGPSEIRLPQQRPAQASASGTHHAPGPAASGAPGGTPAR